MFILIILFNIVRHYFKGFNKPKTKLVYKNSNFLIIDKAYDLKINSNNKLEETLQTYLKRNFTNLANKNLKHEYYFVHRLDFATSGIMCIPKNKNACKIVAEAFSQRLTKKYYLALVRGIVSQEIVDINRAIGQDLRYRDIEKMCTINTSTCLKPREARTVFIVLEYGLFGNYPCTKILIRPITGRRHQIRVHCSHLGHTIVGDYTYSNKKDVEPYRMFLNSTRLCFPFNEESYDFSMKDVFNKDWQNIKTLNVFNDCAFRKLDSALVVAVVSSATLGEVHTEKQSTALSADGSNWSLYNVAALTTAVIAVSVGLAGLISLFLPVTAYKLCLMLGGCQDTMDRYVDRFIADGSGYNAKRGKRSLEYVAPILNTLAAAYDKYADNDLKKKSNTLRF
ncbi:unnamed protein product [Brassicogethes aeneus]|uniref:Pseudouridine synthase RsuA/RluA-like domain-containing protein n=1 Tax=Brassicogethes aeneus TaxID=1431903 RepID=A0A9P0BBL4_BRAAE|nr:unnamed protein product [Brassicogethes aeneus]